MKKRRSGENQNAFGYEGAFYAYTGKIFDLMALSALWLVGCLPIVTIGASSSALYDAVSKSVRKDIGTAGGRFWEAYRRNLRSSLPVWICFGMAALFLLLNIGIVKSKMEGMAEIFFVMFYGFLLLLLIMASCYAFPALARFDMPFGWIIRLSFYLAIRHLPASILLLALLAGTYLLLLWKIVLVVIVPGVSVLLVSFLMEPILERYLSEAGKDDENV